MSKKNDRKIFVVLQQTMTFGLVDITFEKEAGLYYYSHTWSEGKKRCSKERYESSLKLHNEQVKNGMLEKYKGYYGITDEACQYIDLEE